MPDNTLTVILAGGVGSRLAPLTEDRAKPAVPFGGKYRIIDFTLANCLHSGLRRILVFTQYKSHSLQKHLRDGWSIFNPELGEYITPVPPQMRTGESWYSGTADAIYQNLYLLQRSDAEWVVVLSGDHIYRMDYAAMLAFHKENQALLTVGCMEVSMNDAPAFGVMQVDGRQRIISFEEKPHNPAPVPDRPEMAYASMGIYFFNMDLLFDVLARDHHDPQSEHDFGKNIVPSLIDSKKVFAYPFGGIKGRVAQDQYWRDVGTIDAFYDANMDLLEPVPPLNLYQKDWPIRTYQQQLPPARTAPGATGNEGIFINSIISGGSIIAGGSVQHSILFSNVYVGDEAIVEDSLLFDGVRIGDGARVKNAIVEKNIQVPDKESIGIDKEKDHKRFRISDNGVVVVPKSFSFS